MYVCIYSEERRSRTISSYQLKRGLGLRVPTVGLGGPLLKGTLPQLQSFGGLMSHHPPATHLFINFADRGPFWPFLKVNVLALREFLLFARR